MTKRARVRSGQFEINFSSKPPHTAARFRRATVFLLAAFTSLGTIGEPVPPSPTSSAVVTLAPVAVTGVLPGPALWKVSNGDHVMWALGVVSPLPKGMQWESFEVERLVASSQRVLKPPGMEIGASVGFWGRLSLIPSMMGLKKLPDGKTLQQVLEPDVYARWIALKTRYLGDNRSVDRLRPIFAGRELYSAAIGRSGLTDAKLVEKVIYSAALRGGVTVKDTSYLVLLDDPRRTVSQFKKVTLDDQPRLSGIFDAIEQDLVQATLRANAWATGDLQALGKILSSRQQDQCMASLGDTDFAKNLGITDLSSRVRQTSIKAAEDALASDANVVALLPMDRILAADGYLKELQARGYIVQSPDSLAEATADR